MTHPAAVLEYSPPAPPARRRKSRWVWLMLSLPVVVVPFVPFACGESPVGVLKKGSEDVTNLNKEEVEIMLAALPLALGLLIAVWHARVLWRPASAAEYYLAHLAGLTMAGCVVALIGMLGFGTDSLDRVELLTLGLPSGLLGLGFLAWLTLRRRMVPDDRALAALLAGYVSAAALAL